MMANTSHGHHLASTTAVSALLLLFLVFSSCGDDTPQPKDSEPGETGDSSVNPADSGDSSVNPADSADTSVGGPQLADVEGVEATGDPWDYTFAVTVHSPDLDCSQYADWWEVVQDDGTLVYRRILNHSHADEQPCTRTGGPVEIADGDEVIVRAHMNEQGYGGQAMRGSVRDGFVVDPSITATFAAELESADPQPEDCWW